MSAATGATIVAIGGTLCDERLWHGCFGTARHSAIVAGALPSGVPAESDRMAAYVAELLATLPACFALVGFSLGGLVALEIAAQAPDRIAALALICAGAGPETQEGEAWRRRNEERAASVGMAEHVRQDLIPLYGAGAAASPNRETIMRMAEASGLPLYRRQNSLAITRADSRPRLSAMTFPVCLVSGRDDPLCPPARHEDMARALKDVRRIAVEGCGHMLPLERPDVVMDVSEFLASKMDGRH